jgi:16S rRNA (cytidine1402-2'-O)-methyltransferase
MSKNHFGLYLIPSPLHEEGFSFLPEHSWDAISHVQFFIVENVREARRGLRKMGFQRDFNSLEILEWNENTNEEQRTLILKKLSEEKNAALMSDAGLPCIADPGNVVVMKAHELGIPVFPWVGPSSILLTLMGSGLNGQQFRFEGYLPRDRNDRIRSLKELEKKAFTGETQLFMDTPYRNQQVLEDIIANLSTTTFLCIGKEVHSPKQRILTKSIGDWKKTIPQIHKIPVMFAIGIKR